MSRAGKTDHQLGIQKFVIRTPISIDLAIVECAGQESRTKNSMYVTLLKEALAARGVHFDRNNLRVQPLDKAEPITIPIGVNNPAWCSDVLVEVKAIHVHLPDEDEVMASVQFPGVDGGLRTRLVPLVTLRPFTYTPKQLIQDEAGYKEASPIPKNLL